MINLENYEVFGWEHAIRGMRNPMNSWDRSDSAYCIECRACHTCPMLDEYGQCNKPFNEAYVVGENDHDLMTRLAKGGPVHAKYRRMITVYVDINAPLYWWKEFDTYKVGTVANSCSTMHKIHAKEFTMDDFSCEHLDAGNHLIFNNVIVNALNEARNNFLRNGDKADWWQMIQLLPSSYNQKRTVMLNYEVLHNIYISRKNHKLDEWRTFCDWIEKLPYREIITVKESE